MAPELPLRRRRLLGLAAAAVAVPLSAAFYGSWGVISVVGALAMTQGDPLGPLSLFPLGLAVFFAGGIALFFGVIGLLPAGLWAAAAAAFGRPFFNGGTSVWLGLLYGLGFAAPGLLVLSSFEPISFSGGSLDIRPPLLIATLIGGPVAGAVLARLTRRCSA